MLADKIRHLFRNCRCRRCHEGSMHCEECPDCYGKMLALIVASEVVPVAGQKEDIAGLKQDRKELRSLWRMLYLNRGGAHPSKPGAEDAA